MGKNDFLTPKAIGNRIKAKGLQKLRWYCQMCQKQCRDENGFKCHLSSDAHRRQMEVFGQNPGRVIDGYSEEFHRTFIEHLNIAHPNVRIEAHKVYNEYIQDKHHIHMNSTSWLTLTEYVKYLGREGICKVEDTPKGWFIQLVHRDPEQEKLDAERKKRKRAELDESQRQDKEIAAQIERARQVEAARDTTGQGPAADAPPHERDSAAADGPVRMQLAGSATPAVVGAGQARGRLGAGAAMFADASAPAGGAVAPESAGGPRKVDQIMQHEKVKRAQAAAADAAATGGSDAENARAWVCKDIVVKVMAKHLHDYYKLKGRVVAVIDEYVAEVEMVDSGDVLRIDQAELETVIPKVGGRVKILLGKWAGEVAEVMDILKDDFQVRIELKSGKRVREEYEHISKYAT